MSYFFHPEVESELFEAIEYFAELNQTLGLDFSRELFEMVDLSPSSLRHGRRSRSVSADASSVSIRPLIDEVVNDEIYIVAVMHLSREPGYWRSRTDNG